MTHTRILSLLLCCTLITTSGCPSSLMKITVKNTSNTIVEVSAWNREVDDHPYLPLPNTFFPTNGAPHVLQAGNEITFELIQPKSIAYPFGTYSLPNRVRVTEIGVYEILLTDPAESVELTWDGTNFSVTATTPLPTVTRLENFVNGLF